MTTLPPTPRRHPCSGRQPTADLLPTSATASPWIEAEAQCRVIDVGRALPFAGTSSSITAKHWMEQFERNYATAERTDRVEVPSDSPQSAEQTRQAVWELRRLSGLTWEQLGELFDVSRRSIHFWASGKPLNADNEARLLRMLDVVHRGYQGDARATRTALLEVHDGVRPFDLLREGRFDEASEKLGPGKPIRKLRPTQLSPEAQAARKPPPPASLVDALHDGTYEDRGRGRAARTVRSKRRGNT